MFTTLVLTLALAPQTFATDDGVPEVASADATSTLVGDTDAAGRKPKGKGSSDAKGGDERSRSAPAASSERRSSREHDGADASAERKSSRDRDGSKARHESAERRSAPAASASRHRTPSHAPAVRHAPARSTSAARHRDAVRGHHSSWQAHHRSGWFTPWRSGHAHHWSHGVFVYGPAPVIVAGGGGRSGSKASAPKRTVDRAGKFSLGVHGGSYLSDFHEGGGYGDAGLGLSASYRPVEALSLEVAWTHHDSTWSQDSARVQEPLQASVALHAFSWSPVSPYVLAGVTMTDREIDQPLARGGLSTSESLWGPHAGVGIEFALGKQVALDFDARFIGYVNKPADDPSRAGAVQANMGLEFYF